MALSPEHRRLLIVDQGVGAFVVNFLLNGCIAWALFHSVGRVPLWGQSSIAGDTFVTAFVLPLLTCLIVTRIVQRQLARGRVLPLAGAPTSRAIRALSSMSTVRRAVALGFGGVVAAALPTVLWFVWAGPSELPLDSFLWFKATFAAALAAGVAPLIAWLALASPRSRTRVA